LDLTVRTYTYYSYCEYEGVGACCLTAADGSTLDEDNEICSLGYCSHNGWTYDSKRLNTLYLFCNLTTTNDSLCGDSSVVLSNYSVSSKAVYIKYDPSTINETNTTNSTNSTNNNGTNNNGNTTNNNDTGTGNQTSQNNTNNSSSNNNN